MPVLHRIADCKEVARDDSETRRSKLYAANDLRAATSSWASRLFFRCQTEPSSFRQSGLLRFDNTQRDGLSSIITLYIVASISLHRYPKSSPESRDTRNILMPVSVNPEFIRLWCDVDGHECGMKHMSDFMSRDSGGLGPLGSGMRGKFSDLKVRYLHECRFHLNLIICSEIGRPQHVKTRQGCSSACASR